MFNYIIGVIVALLGTTAGLVGLQNNATTPALQPIAEQRMFLGENAPRTIAQDDTPDTLEQELNDIRIDDTIFGTLDDTHKLSLQGNNTEEDLWEEDDEEEYGEETHRVPARTPTVAPKPITPAVTTPKPVTAPAIASGITVVELAKHNTEKNCWIAFEGAVYDITAIIPWHPGGPDMIIPYCGTADAFTQAFQGQHGLRQVNNLMRRAFSKGSIVK